MPGTITVSAFGTMPLSGAGTLLNLNFTSTGAIGTTSPLTFTLFKLNEGVPCVNKTNGSVTVISGTISGNVYYAGMLLKGVPNTNINAAGSVPVMAITDGNGDYTLSGFGPGPYTVTPSKTGDVNGSVTGFDASLVAQYDAGLITLTPTQQIAADVTGDGTISALDAAYIAQFDANIPNPGREGTWVFDPLNRMYSDVETSYTNQDYQAILYGDVSQDWMPTMSPMPPMNNTPTATKQEFELNRTAKAQSPQVIGVMAPVQDVGANTNFAATLTASDTTGQNVFSYSFNLVYDPSVILPSANLCDGVGTISSSYSLTCNPNFATNTIRVVAFGTSALSGSGPLLKLNFATTGAAPGSTSPLTIQNFKFNEGVPQNVATPGSVTITGPTTAGASIGGQLRNAQGMGLANTQVTLINNRGEKRGVRSDSLGYFKFSDVPTGGTYTISVKSLKYKFATQVVNLTQDLDNLVFTAER